ncbi:MAG: TetR/AcrR family transcriptional regulator [Acinetobacter sp.]|uniref:TetR/AcrR family transcriptional regulator n=1 Tax=Acinetobacter sp. TaxID=472 RepID=UPI00258EB84C|nr:TetR/AcrR family transcriptional regulator [Acinetobacter sp.]MCE1270670.1 TetR/AcrR family transcriptional regulator [Acinetobacter sp.]
MTNDCTKLKKVLTGRPTRQDSQALHDHLLNIASVYFLEHGFQASSIEGIAKKAQVSKLTIYRQYQNKTNLFIAVIQAGVEQYIVDIRDWSRNKTVNAESLYELGMFISRRWFSLENIRLLRMTIPEVQRIQELSDMINALMTQSRQPVEEFLAKLNQQKGYHIENIGTATIQFIQLCVSGHYYLLRDESYLPSTDMLEENVQNTVRLFLNGYQSRNESALRGPV